MSRSLKIIKKDKVKKNIQQTKKFIKEKSDGQDISLLNDNDNQILGYQPDPEDELVTNPKLDDSQKEETYSKFIITSEKITDIDPERVIAELEPIDEPTVYQPQDFVPVEPSPSMQTPAQNAEMPRMTWDPRLIRVDAFNAGVGVVPFSTDSAASAYYDQVFTIEKAIVDYDNANGKRLTGDPQTSSGRATASAPTSVVGGAPGQGSNKVTPKNNVWDHMKHNPDMYGSQSLVNPYCVTRLIGGLSMVTADANWTGFDKGGITHMYDIRDQRRFYDNVQSLDRHTTQGIVSDPDDFTSINNPTVDNIIKWSNNDRWGRTPYSFQDFLFCKYWKIIPNNRLVTLRKYAVPTYDNLNFPNMMTEDNKENNFAVAPIATVVTYFGGDSGNSLSSLMSFTTGTNWETINADIHNVSGNEGSNPRALIDQMFEGTQGQPGFGGQNPVSNIIGQLTKPFGGITADYISFGKFVGLLDKDGYDKHSQEATNRLNQAMVDPRESIYANRILGPVNRISSVMKRKEGLEFSQSFKLSCEYIARPIGGVNSKAALLDILANCMEMASADAIFWGGGQRFMVTPSVYPFKGMAGSNSIMDALYAGKIFGKDGALEKGMAGVKNFSGSALDWSNLTQKMGSILSQTVGAVGSMLQSISSTLFGETSSLTGILKKATDALSSEDDQAAGSSKLENFLTNVNKMWKDRVVQQSIAPNLSGMKALLTGEPTGNWHLTVGNPLNPMMVCGNLVCKNMEVSWSEEIGPDDFPMGLKVVYTIEHAMPRDKASIQSMFNRGGGKIYNLPDYIRAVSDYESTVDDFTGKNNKDLSGDGSWMTPAFMHVDNIKALNKGIGEYGTFKIDPGKDLPMLGNPATTQLTIFQPIDPANARTIDLGKDPAAAIRNANKSPQSKFFANIHTRKYNNG